MPGLRGCAVSGVPLVLTLLVAVASLVVEQGLWGTQASAVAALGLQSTGSTVVAHRLSCSVACEIFLNQGPNLCLLHWQADSLPLSHQGSPALSLSFAFVCTCGVLLAG